MSEAILVLMLALFGLLVLGLLAGSLVWVYRDANRRGKPGWLVALLVLLLDWPISLLVWLVFRPEIRS